MREGAGNIGAAYGDCVHLWKVSPEAVDSRAHGCAFLSGYNGR